MSNLKQTLTRKFGPFPVWVWAIVGGGLLYWYRSRTSSGAANTSNTATGGADITPPTPQDPITLQPGESVYDPNTGQLIGSSPGEFPPQITDPGQGVYNPVTGGIVTAPGSDGQPGPGNPGGPLSRAQRKRQWNTWWQARWKRRQQLKRQHSGGRAARPSGNFKRRARSAATTRNRAGGRSSGRTSRESVSGSRNRTRQPSAGNSRARSTTWRRTGEVRRQRVSEPQRETARRRPSQQPTHAPTPQRANKGRSAKREQPRSRHRRH